MTKHYGIEFGLLSDTNNTVARDFGSVLHQQEEIQSVYDDLGLNLPTWYDDESFDPPLPASYALDTGSVVQIAFVDPGYTTRLDQTETIRTIRTIHV
ncbi:MAG TPA: hypothetical protein DHW45_13440 [Candidatus Latescibacteria bacterium]|jgi:peroxiredoxin|nr:hypothetical protein [Candidatus Latescibacterota bacterium]